MKREQIFYSWMDDGDAKFNRYFIEECLISDALTEARLLASEDGSESRQGP